MMDSQETTLEQGILNEGKQAEETQTSATAETTNNAEGQDMTQQASADTPVAEKAATDTTADNTTDDPAKHVFKNKQEVLERTKELAHSDEVPTKAEIDHLKSVFYKFNIAQRDADMKAYIDGGGDPAQYQILPDDDEETFKAEMQLIKEKRAKVFLQQEEEKQQNLQKKLDILEKIKAMTESPEKASESYDAFKDLQAQWKTLNPVPAEKANELWHNYQLYVEQFYDMLNLNREAREYDFKKNLEAKTKLCEEAEKLADEPDVIKAFHELQDLHEQYREIGPVAKDLRESIWARFKAASTVINKKHQQHFDDLRAQEEENLKKKTALCEQAEALVASERKTAGDWDKQTQQIIDIQKEWKKIGFAPQKMNQKIFDRFRASCDTFFAQKAEFFKTLKAEYADNATKKRDLITKVKALQDSTEWKTTADKIIELQKEWKKIGPVAHKLGDELWAEFNGACNHFFEARNNAHADVHQEERENLQKKQDIIAQLEKLAEEKTEGLQAKVQALVEQYNKVGHVPFKEKDKVFDAYHAILDKLYKDLHVAIQTKRLDKFKNNLKNVAQRGEDALDNERGRLQHRLDQLKYEIATYENNLGFLSVSSKKGNSLIDEMNRKVQKLKDDAKLLKDKIKAIDNENK